MDSSYMLLLGTTFLLGLRHSLDVDHLAAITDISAAQSTKKSAYLGSLAYALGHAGIVFLLGSLALLLGFSLPGFLSTIMQKIVGVTLILLALAVLYSAFNSREGKLISRWRLLFILSKKLINWLRADKKETENKAEDLGFGGCFLIGVLHGVGVESPTQLLALGSAAALSSWHSGLTLITTFITGMIISNMLIATVSIYGFQSARRRQQVFLLLSIASAILSAVIGIKCILD